MSAMNSTEDLSQEYCNKSLEEFVKITNTDIGLAMFYLGDCNYDLKIALEKYNAEDHIVIRGFTVPCSQIRNNELKNFRVMSWNIEGLAKKDFQKRIDLTIKTIVSSKANIVLLQELVEDNEKEIRKQLEKDYTIFMSNQSADSYYSGILIKKDPDIKVLRGSFEAKRFKSTVMDREMLVLKVEINEIPVKIITAHLESTKDFSEQRKEQLVTVYEEMKRDTRYSIFAGDLNLRDKEVKEIGGIPANIVDVWEASGSRREVRFTWDPKRNLNASELCPGAFGQRFDRMYFYSKPFSGDSKRIKCAFFGLEGLKKVEGGIRFPSDHWAIMGHFLFE